MDTYAYSTPTLRGSNPVEAPIIIRSASGIRWALRLAAVYSFFARPAAVGAVVFATTLYVLGGVR